MIEEINIQETLEQGDPTQIKNLLIKCILDLDEYQAVDWSIIKEIYTKHIYPEFN